ALAGEPLPALRGLDENLLRQIIRIGGVLYISPTDPPHEIVMARIQLPEALPHHVRPAFKFRSPREIGHERRTMQRACRSLGHGRLYAVLRRNPVFPRTA